MLAGVSPDYYARLEQGRAANVSDQVLDAVAAALRLDDLERRHLTDLVKPRANASAEDSLRVRPELRAMVDALDPTPAVLHGPRLEVLVINGAAAALIDDFGAMPEPERNMVRWMFLDPKARRIYPDWPEVAAQMVAILRVAGGRNRADARLAELVTELSDSFRGVRLCLGRSEPVPAHARAQAISSQRHRHHHAQLRDSALACRSRAFADPLHRRRRFARGSKAARTRPHLDIPGTVRRRIGAVCLQEIRHRRKLVAPRHPSAGPLLIDSCPRTQERVLPDNKTDDSAPRRMREIQCSSRS